MNDCDWYFAESLDQAIEKYKSDFSPHESDCENARPLTEIEMNTLIFFDSENKDESDPKHWICECGKTPDGHSRWNGSAWQCHHGYPIGHVDMVNIHRRTFRQQLEKLKSNGQDCGFFATTEF